MYVIAIYAPYNRPSRFHNYEPATREEAHAVARELSRDFPDNHVVAYDPANGYARVTAYVNGNMRNA